MKCKDIKTIIYKKKFVVALWFIVAFAATLKQFSSGVSNNYLIFKHVFFNTLDQTNLYIESTLYHDTNHYGPIFSLIIAPFAILPDALGSTLWGLCMALSLYIAIIKLPVDWKSQALILLIATNELFTSTTSLQTNPLVAALLIGSFIAIDKKKDFWAALFIALGLFIKLYGIVGFCFFFFSKQKARLLAYFVLWSIVLFILPMSISSPEFILQSYQDWYHSIVDKNMENANSLMQDVSVMGIIRRVSGNREISNMAVMLPALILFALQYIKTELYKDLNYRLAILASTLLFIVLFSSSSESPTYIIAMTGVGIWFVIQKKPVNKYIISLLIFALVLTSLSPTDIVPKAARIFIREYSLKALPCLLIWLVLIWQIFTYKMAAKEPIMKDTKNIL